MKVSFEDLKRIFFKTTPVLAGYIVLGTGFGIYASKEEIELPYVLLMSTLVYAGSMQYVLVDLISIHATLLTVALTTFMVNARHFFYGISMMDKYKDRDLKSTYMKFALTDETYSLVCTQKEEKTTYFLVSFLNQLYWILGSLIGSLLGNTLPFSTDGIEFSMTALFITVFLEQWLTMKNHLPAITGLISTILCLIVFGKNQFLIPSMLLITLSLFLERKKNEEKGLR